MPPRQSSCGAFCVAHVRPQSARAIAHTAGLLALIFLLSTGCRTPWSIEPLPIDQLEAGMDRDAVARVLGEPEWSDSIGETRSPGALPGSEAASDTQLVTAWGYQDERVDPGGLFFAGLFLPIYAPFYMLSLALPIDESERDCVWTDWR